MALLAIDILANMRTGTETMSVYVYMRGRKNEKVLAGVNSKH